MKKTHRITINRKTKQALLFLKEATDQIELSADSNNPDEVIADRKVKYVFTEIKKDAGMFDELEAERYAHDIHIRMRNLLGVESEVIMGISTDGDPEDVYDTAFKPYYR